MRILLGITGSVAAVLTPKLVAGLLAANHEVKIVATTPALYFLKTPPFDVDNLTLNLAEKKVEVYIDKYEWPAGGYHKDDPVRHIEFRDWADIFLIAPLSANTLAKITHGLADNFLSCIARAWPKHKPFVIAPAMNTEMWTNDITYQQITEIKKRYHGFYLIHPIKKKLACGDNGMGAMAEIKTIIDTVAKIK